MASDGMRCVCGCWATQSFPFQFLLRWMISGVTCRSTKSGHQCVSEEWMRNHWLWPLTFFLLLRIFMKMVSWLASHWRQPCMVSSSSFFRMKNNHWHSRCQCVISHHHVAHANRSRRAIAMLRWLHNGAGGRAIERKCLFNYFFSRYFKLIKTYFTTPRLPICCMRRMMAYYLEIASARATREYNVLYLRGILFGNKIIDKCVKFSSKPSHPHTYSWSMVSTSGASWPRKERKIASKWTINYFLYVNKMLNSPFIL